MFEILLAHASRDVRMQIVNVDDPIARFSYRTDLLLIAWLTACCMLRQRAPVRAPGKGDKMFMRKLSFRRGICSLFLGAVYLALAHPALAWNEPLWVRQFGTVRPDNASGVATDLAGNVYIIGDSLAPSLNTNSWVRKYNSDGALIWKRDIPLDGILFAYGIATDLDRNVYVTGHWGDNTWLVKYNARGELLWQKPDIGASGPTRDIAADLAGNVYLTGSTYGSPEDAWVARLDSAGNMLWEAHLGTDEFDGASGVATDIAGNAYVSGTTYGSLGGPNRGSYDAWIAKYDAAGRLLWKQQLGTAEDDFGSDVATDAVGHVYVAGNFGPPESTLKPWLAKLDASGRVRWQRRLAVFGTATGIATDAVHSVYVTGGVNNDAWLAKYDGAGRLQWNRLLGTDTYDWSSGVATDSKGNVYMSGTTGGALVGRNRGSLDAWLAKYSAKR